MGGFKRFELLDPSSCYSLFYNETSICKPRTPLLSPLEAVELQLGFALDVLNPRSHHLYLPFQCVLPHPPLSPLDFFQSTADLIQIEASLSAAVSPSLLRRSQEGAEAELRLRSLGDRIAALELQGMRCPGIDARPARDREYKWTAEIKWPRADGSDRRYTWTAEARGGADRSFKSTAEVKGKGKDAPASRKYTFQASTSRAVGKGDAVGEGRKSKREAGAATRVVEIKELANQEAITIKKAYAKRALHHSKGRKELSPQDAASIIQLCFRAHLVRRSRVLRGLRDLAVAKAKLKEIRTLFSNFSYRHRIAHDTDECQRFSDKIVVLLLTVDAIEAPDYMGRAARRSMVEELEAMLAVVDPQPPGKLGWMKLRRFDLLAGGSISRELALGVADVVHMLDQEDDGSNVLPGCCL